MTTFNLIHLIYNNLTYYSVVNTSTQVYLFKAQQKIIKNMICIMFSMHQMYAKVKLLISVLKSVLKCVHLIIKCLFCRLFH